MLTFAQVEAAFRRCYNRLREVNSENAPSSYTWYAESLEALKEETGREFNGASEQAGAVAYVFECNGHTLTIIQSEWSVEETEDFFWLCFGFFDEPFPRDESSS